MSNSMKYLNHISTPRTRCRKSRSTDKEWWLIYPISIDPLLTSKKFHQELINFFWKSLATQYTKIAISAFQESRIHMQQIKKWKTLQLLVYHETVNEDTVNRRRILFLYGRPTMFILISYW